MHDCFSFNNIRDELIFISVLSVILLIALFYEYRQKQLEKKYKALKNLWRQDDK